MQWMSTIESDTMKPMTVKDFQQRALDRGMWQSCINCDSWGNHKDKLGSPLKDICIKFNMTPPANIIVNGCDNWFDDIPF